jgi:hypothetical protein
MSSNRTDAEQLQAIFDSTTDSLTEASDQDILDEARLQGLDPDAEATRVKALMLETVRAFQQRALREARKAYDAQSAQTAKQHSIPNTPSERRELFSFVLTRQPQYAELFTAQHREFTDLTDSDIETYLEDLAELGVLNKLRPDTGDDET